jgi:PAS domain S-box-containing protein
MEYHKTLERHLNRLKMKGTTLPSDLNVWGNFLDLISKTYGEADQERYLLERSMEISSREMFELNQRLETAQHIARLGYWEVELAHEKVFWSKELYALHGLAPEESPPHYEEFLNMIHEEDRDHMKKLLEDARTNFENYENELRIKGTDGEYHWFYVTFHRILREGLEYLRGVVLDISTRKKTEQEISELHNQLVLSARLAGMADIAASTLHNIGNVLNSAHVSIEFLKERLSQSEMKTVGQVVDLLEKNSDHLSEYLQNDPQGKYIPEYILALFKTLKKEYDTISQEIDRISKNMSHINDIILTQNDISRTLGMKEKVFLPQIIDAALGMADTSFDQYNIHVEKKYQETPYLIVDKVKLLQILINLIRNAKESLIRSSEDEERIMTLSLEEENSSHQMKICIKDTGIGILKENMSKIFSLGFTTKERGHGLGLHMSALNAQEMGGKMTVESEGPGKGATFTIFIPKIEATPSSEVSQK